MLGEIGNIIVLENDEFKTVSVDLQESEISNETMHKYIDGHMETFNFNTQMFENNITCFCDENGKLKNLPVSIVVCDKHVDVIETVNGNVVFAGFDEKGRTLPLTDEQIQIVKEELMLCVEIELSDGSKKKVRMLRWNGYEESEIADDSKNIIEVKTNKNEKNRSCNICGCLNASIFVNLGRNNVSTQIAFCNECFESFAEKIWEFLSTKE